MTLWRSAALMAVLGLILLMGSPVRGIERRALSQLRGARATADSCIVDITGDVNESGSITSADIIYLVNSVFLSGPAPQPCMGAGDVNCSGQVSPADIIWLVNYVFKSGGAPCDICTSPYAQVWGCLQ